MISADLVNFIEFIFGLFYFFISNFFLLLVTIFHFLIVFWVVIVTGI